MVYIMRKKMVYIMRKKAVKDRSINPLPSRKYYSVLNAVYKRFMFDDKIFLRL